MRSSLRHPLLGSGRRCREICGGPPRPGTDPIGFWNSHTLLISQIGINGILASSMFTVLYSGQLSLAAPGFMAIGAYTALLMELYWHTPLALNFAAGTALAGIVGLL